MSGYSDLGGSAYSQAMSGFLADSTTATRDIMPARAILASRARVLDMSNPTAKAAVDRIKSGIVGAGLTYSTRGESRFLTPEAYGPISEAISRHLSMASACYEMDAQHRLTFEQMQVLACRNWLLTGDVFLVRRPGTHGCAWRIIEGDRCATPPWFTPENPYSVASINPDTNNRIIDGVELDAESIPVAYWFMRKFGAWTAADRDAWTRIEARDPWGLPFVIHLFRPERPDQYRGVPLISSVIEKIWSMQCYSKAELQAAILESCYALFIRSDVRPTQDPFAPVSAEELDRPLVPDTNPGEGDESFYLSPDAAAAGQSGVGKLPPGMIPGAARPVMAIGPGETRRLLPGEDVVTVDPKRPTSGYTNFMSFGYREVGAAVGVSHSVIEGSYDGMTYAASRGAIIEASRTYKELRGFFIGAFMRPIMEVFAYCVLYESPELRALLEPASTGTLLQAARAVSLDAVWNAPVSVCLDPKAELDAARAAIEMGLIDADEAALAIYGHAAKGRPQTADGGQ